MESQGEKRVAVIPGDGIGKEVMAQALRVIDTVAARYGHRIRTEEALAGGGALDHGEALRNLAEKLGAAVIPTVAGKGAIPEDHPLNCGSCLISPVAHEFVENADLVIAVGTELAETDIWKDTDFLELRGRLIRIDVDPGSLSRDYAPDAALLGDAGLAMEMLEEALPDGGANPGFSGSGAVGALRRRVKERLLEDPRAARFAAVLDAMREAIPEDGWLVTDATQIAYFANEYWPTSHPRSYTHPNGYCTLGSALPSAIGAKLGSPTRDGAALAGDAGFLFTATELATAVNEGVSLPVVLWNNDGLGQIRDDMVKHDIAPTGVTPGRNPDFPALARAFGAHAVTPRSLDGLTGAIREAFDAGGPTLIEVREDADFIA